MSDLQENVDELQSGGTESEDAEVNHNLFQDQHGFRIAFFLHESIKRSFLRRNLTRDIEVCHDSPVYSYLSLMYFYLQRHGGIVLDTDIGCDTVLVDVQYDKKDTLQISYDSDDDPRLRKVYVERVAFVQRCIRNNHFVHRMPALKGMGGAVGRG